MLRFVAVVGAVVMLVQKWVAILMLASGILLSSSVEAASVQKCSAKTRRCTIKLTDGVVGDTVKVLDERAHVAGVGWIVKRKGSYAVIAFKTVFRTVRRGYPVIVDIESRGQDLKWAADDGN